LPTLSDTSASNPTRELAAIMFSDIAGYTAIMERNHCDGGFVEQAESDPI
jgi:class 3 adenylate cyclase